ncbi:MAG: C40 family peptidase [Acidobacteriota bacterium]|nr:C40 family peptidase [Acidobacteriota bacterium]
MPADAGALTILGPSSLTGQQISAWLAANNHVVGWGDIFTGQSVSIDQVAALYITEGAAQGVRGDVAFAQACLETGYFAAPNAGPLLAKNNYAGIAVATEFSAGDGWPTPQLGVRAHIQLLAKVVGGNGVALANPDVSPQWLGRPASTWSGLNDNWAVPGTTYGQQIISIYNTILGGNPVLSVDSTGNITTAAPSSSPPPPGLPVVQPAAGQIPGIDPRWTAPGRITASTFQWSVLTPQGLPKSDLLSSIITTESAVDLTKDQLSQIQLTVVDVDGDITGGIPGLLNQDSGQVGPYLVWGSDVLVVAEYQTTDTNQIPGAIITLRTGCLQWMAATRKMQVWTGLSATQWIEQCVLQYNEQLPPGVPPATFLGDYTETRPQIMANASLPVTQWMSYYDVAQQLCYDEGYWLFESGGTVVFGKPTWLATVAPSFKIGVNGRSNYPIDPDAVATLNIPRCLRSVSLFTGDTLMVDLPHSLGEQVRVGQLLELSGVPYFSSKQWLVTGVQWAYDGQTPVTITANEVKDPVAAQPGGVAPSPPQTDPTGHPPQATSVQFVQIAESQVGVPYVWGGEQAGVGFDCSGLVQWALSQLGVTFPRVSGDQWAACAAIPGAVEPVPLASITYGALLFVDSADGTPGGEHVAISLGQTRNNDTEVLVLQAPYPGAQVGTSWVPESYWSRAAIIPYLNYGTG